MAKLKFRVSSALKTIIGKELITDDFIAVFELVKNSFDAQATRVDISFENLRTPETRIIIKDNGNGMDRADLKNKWLFVAYSEKALKENYRDKISSGRIFAGSKGIGRFSCDRLGSLLNMYTRPKGQRREWNSLEVNWSKFEEDSVTEFQEIPATHTTMDTIPHKLGHGTVLEISEVRSSDWGRDKLLRLRRSLERLVNPYQENDSKNFHIFLWAPDEKIEDAQIKRQAKNKGEIAEQWNLVNGEVRNFLFENLGLKTAQIRVEIDRSADHITTRLEDRGTLIYELTEKNPYGLAFSRINIHLFALNRSAKYAFTKHMGLRARDYGSVFLYKNGFRIHPFGDPDDDNLGIDRRHQQRFFGTLGTRDLSGRIEINGHNPSFKETTSRDGGLIKNEAFNNLKELVIDYGVKRLERFVIGLSAFGIGKGELPDQKTLSKVEVKEKIFDIVAKLTRSEKVIDLRYDPAFLNILELKSEKSVSAILRSLKRITTEQGSDALMAEVVKAEKTLHRLLKTKEEAEAAEARERERAERAEATAKEEKEEREKAQERTRQEAVKAQRAEYKRRQLDSQNVFLKSMLSRDLDHIVALHHSIAQDALTIEMNITNIFTSLKGKKAVKVETLSESLQRISFLVKKISAVSRFATQANHGATQEQLDGDLVEYIREYLLNIYEGVVVDPHRKVIPIRYKQPKGAQFTTVFAPLLMSIIFDNLISNARKHKVSNIDVVVKKAGPEKLVVVFSDDGAGIPKKNMASLFKIGFSTTDGSGLGLHHIREIMGRMKGSVEAVHGKGKGAEFILTFVRDPRSS